MNGLAWLLGSLAGKAMDPVSWIVMAIALALGALRMAWYWPLLPAAIGAAVVTALILPQHRLLGLASEPGQVFFIQLVLISILAMLAYGVGRASGADKKTEKGT